jgi:hypothetical protein
LALLIVSQHSIGLFYLLEFTGVSALVRMVLAGQPSIGSFDLVG